MRQQKPPRKPVVYLVHWPEISVMKAGISTRKRWRAFLQRGAVVVDLVEFDDYFEASAFESVAVEGLRTLGPYGFSSAEEAAPYLGGNGGGYRECFKIPSGAEPMTLLRSVNWMSI